MAEGFLRYVSLLAEDFLRYEILKIAEDLLRYEQLLAEDFLRCDQLFIFPFQFSRTFSTLNMI